MDKDRGHKRKGTEEQRERGGHMDDKKTQPQC